VTVPDPGWADLLFNVGFAIAGAVAGFFGYRIVRKNGERRR